MLLPNNKYAIASHIISLSKSYISLIVNNLLRQINGYSWAVMNSDCWWYSIMLWVLIMMGFIGVTVSPLFNFGFSLSFLFWRGIFPLVNPCLSFGLPLYLLFRSFRMLCSPLLNFGFSFNFVFWSGTFPLVDPCLSFSLAFIQESNFFDDFSEHYHFLL